MKTLSSSDCQQVDGSIDKLFHYLMVFVKEDTRVRVRMEDHYAYERWFRAPCKVSISPTLYTRIDNCHGAGNCCRVPFDLVYTNYDRSRIEHFDYNAALDMFGKESATRFLENRDVLLDELIPFNVQFSTSKHQTVIWLRLNHEVIEISGRKSCPYLFMGEDRYFCGVHPFKPLHCWYPHMTIRVLEPHDGDRPSISIGRQQYGRNFKFGCPVLFTEVEQDEDDALFVESQALGKLSYFDSQFKDDIDKLKWTSDSAQSMGFTPASNFVVGIHEIVKAREMEMRLALSVGR